MTKVKINGYNRSEDARIFDILSRKELEKRIDDVDPYEVYKETLKKAMGCRLSGIAYTYIDARDGSIKTNWLQQNNFLHPFDSSYEIILCSIKSPVQEPEDYHLLNEQEFDEFIEFRQETGGDAKEFIIKQYGEKEYDERIENWVDWLATEFTLDLEDIDRQIDNLYSTEVIE